MIIYKSLFLKIIILIIGTIILTYFLHNKKDKINKLNNSNNTNNKTTSLRKKSNLNSDYINASVIIPVYNCEKTINFSILSIQKQNLTNLEIILVNDFSQDNSLNIIETFQKNDSRIKIINNKKNYGTLYSRSIGALSSKGTYIFSLDNDDRFYREDSLDYIYRQAIEGKYDIVNYKRIYSRNYNQINIRIRNINNNNKFSIIHQPELAIYPISRNGKFFPNSYFVWDKCIKMDIYKQAVQMLGNEIYTHNISYNEDIIIVFIIFSISNSMKIINRYGLIHFIYRDSTARTRKREYKAYCNIYLLDILFRFSKNNANKNFCVDYISRNWRFIIKSLTKDYMIYLNKILYKIVKDIYISKRNKNIINKYIKEIELRMK